jgi:hypothetical protein
MNERDFPHLVELELPPGGLPSQNLEFDAFHREHGIPIRRGRGRHEARAGDGGGRPGERARTLRQCSWCSGEHGEHTP